jgi:Flp pilus assembly protein TadD
LADCNEAIKLKAGNGNAFDNRGLAYLKLGQLEQAIVDFDSALKFNPKVPGSLFGRGMAKLARGDSAGAADIEAAKSLKPNIAEIFAKSGVSEILAKKPEEAPVRKPE